MEAQVWARTLVDAAGTVIYGKEQVIEKLLVTLLCRGHALLEDVPGVGKTVLARALFHLPGRGVPPHSVHPGPVAGGRAGRLGVPRPDRPVRVPAGADRDQHPAGGRDQPRHAAHPVGAAGSDVRGPDQRRGRDHAAARSVLHACHREPGRVRGHLSAARGAARPLLPHLAHGLPDAGGGAGDPARPAPA